MEAISLWTVSASFLTLLALAIILPRTRNSSSIINWPPGPKTLPIIGNLHQLGGQLLHVALTNLAKVHGGVMTIWIGSWRPIIVISSPEEVWEVLVKKSPDYAARDMPEITKLITGYWHTISSSHSGQFWSNLRKGLQNGPLGPLNITTQMSFQERNIKRMISDIQEEATFNGGIVKPLEHLKKATLRLLSHIIFGQSFDDDQFIDSMHHQIEELIRINGFAPLVDAFSYAKYLPSHKRAIKETYRVKNQIEQLVRPVIASSPPANCYLHFLLSQGYSEEVVIYSIVELYSLGVDSTASTTTWALAFLIHDQTVQDKLYQDIKHIAATDALVKIEDLSALHYLEAVMKETMRMKPIAPLAIPHKTSKDTTVRGTKVAAGTCVLVNLYALHHDHKIWAKPHKFMPERFLEGNVNGGDSSGANVKVIEQSFLPFGAGMRICAGMELGKLQFSFALANLVNAFKWTSVVDGKLPDMSEELKFIMLMKTPLEARIIPRNSLN
nr:putative CYP719 [synthetic construct]